MDIKANVIAAAAIYKELATAGEGSSSVGKDAFERVVTDVMKLDGGMDTVKKVDDCRLVANSGAIRAAGELALDAYKAKGVKEYTFSADQAGNHLDIHVNAEKVIKLNFAKEGEPTEKTIHGATQVVYKTYDSSNKGEIAASREAVKEAFASAFKK